MEINQESLSELTISDLYGMHDYIMHRYDADDEEHRLDKIKALETELKRRENNLFII